MFEYELGCSDKCKKDGKSEIFVVQFFLQTRQEQNRTEQNRTEQNRTEQNRTEQNRTFHELPSLRQLKKRLNLPRKKPYPMRVNYI
jgi:hypothetical protein